MLDINSKKREMRSKRKEEKLKKAQTKEDEFLEQLLGVGEEEGQGEKSERGGDLDVSLDPNIDER